MSALGRNGGGKRWDSQFQGYSWVLFPRNLKVPVVFHSPAIILVYEEDWRVGHDGVGVRGFV